MPGWDSLENTLQLIHLVQNNTKSQKTYKKLDKQFKSYNQTAEYGKNMFRDLSIVDNEKGLNITLRLYSALISLKVGITMLASAKLGIERLWNSLWGYETEYQII